MIWIWYCLFAIFLKGFHGSLRMCVQTTRWSMASNRSLKISKRKTIKNMEPEKLKMMLMLPMFLAILGVFFWYVEMSASKVKWPPHRKLKTRPLWITCLFVFFSAFFKFHFLHFRMAQEAQDRYQHAVHATLDAWQTESTWRSVFFAASQPLDWKTSTVTGLVRANI